MDKIDSCFNFTFKRADGVYLYGLDNEKVLDFSGANCANAFGHGNKIIENTFP